MWDLACLLECGMLVYKMPKCPSFTLNKQSSRALATTRRGIANLIKNLLNENYDYILIARFHSNPIEHLFGKYRQMSGEYFLVSMREVSNSEKIMTFNSITNDFMINFMNF